MSELKPCPFCGGTNLRYEQYMRSVYIVCNNCGNTGETGFNDLEAAELWNRRAEVPKRIDGKPAGMSAEQFDACYEDDSDER